MDLAYLHLVTNHIPIIGIPFALALLVIGIWRKSDEIKSVSFLIFFVLGVTTLIVFLLGQGGEDFVEDLAGVSGDAIHDHEASAKIALISVGVCAALSLAALFYYKGIYFLKPQFRREQKNADAVPPSAAAFFPGWLVLALLVAALASGAVLGFTGKLGGKIRHVEFYSGANGTINDGQNNETDQKGDKGRGRNRRGQ